MDDGDDSIREKTPSPDWLRSFQGPSKDLVAISSSSEPFPSNSPPRNEENTHDQAVSERVEIDDSDFVDIRDKKSTVKSMMLQKKKKEEDSDLFDIGDDKSIAKEKESKTMKKEQQVDQCLLEGLEDAYEGGSSKKPSLHNVSSRFPLILPEKVQRSKALIECEGDSIDLSGDVGAVGRVIISKNASGNDDMLLDLKGTIYKSRIVPSTTFCIVSFGQTEAKEPLMVFHLVLTMRETIYQKLLLVKLIKTTKVWIKLRGREVGKWIKDRLWLERKPKLLGSQSREQLGSLKLQRKIILESISPFHLPFIISKASNAISHFHLKLVNDYRDKMRNIREKNPGKIKAFAEEAICSCLSPLSWFCVD